MKKVKFSNKNKVIDFYKNNPPIEISNYINYKKKKQRVPILNKKKSYFLENNQIKKMIHVGSITSLFLLGGILMVYIQKKK